MKQINIELLREFVDYNPETGSMTWKERDISHFSSERYFKAWNIRFAGKECGNVTNKGYRYMKIKGDSFFVHRAAWAYHHGYWPRMEIDHKNHDRSDNRISNLRDTSENAKNHSKQSNNKSGYTGVYWHKGKQKWHVKVGGKHRGQFKDLELAGFVAELTRDKLGYHPNHGS